jgi:hypothetical protein
MSPIRRRMKKRNPSGGQNGQLVHWWLLIHSGPVIRSDYVLTEMHISESAREGPSCLQGIDERQL